MQWRLNMKAIIVGANGRVGQKLSQTLAKQGIQVFAASRQPFQTTQRNIQPISFDLHQSAEDMAKVFQAIAPDIIYFTAGSRGKNLLQIDAFGAVKTIEAAKQAGVKRFILLSSVFATEPQQWQQGFLADLTDYNIAKFFADHWLMKSGLDYSILQPGHLLETVGTGKVQFNVSRPLSNSIDNVVQVLAQLPHYPASLGKIITMGDGNKPIAQALAMLIRGG